MPWQSYGVNAAPEVKGLHERQRIWDKVVALCSRVGLTAESRGDEIA
jgi:hypothetical protein